MSIPSPNWGGPDAQQEGFTFGRAQVSDRHVLGCVFLRSKARPAAERKEPPLSLPAGEGQWVECVNSADIQTGSGGQTERKKKEKQPEECMPQVPGPGAWGFCSFLVSKDLTRSVRSRLKKQFRGMLSFKWIMRPERMWFYLKISKRAFSRTPKLKARGGKKGSYTNSLNFNINKIKCEFDYAVLQLHIMFLSITSANLLIPLVIRYVHFNTSCCPLKSSTIKMLDCKLFSGY